MKTCSTVEDAPVPLSILSTTVVVVICAVQYNHAIFADLALLLTLVTFSQGSCLAIPVQSVAPVTVVPFVVLLHRAEMPSLVLEQKLEVLFATCVHLSLLMVLVNVSVVVLIAYVGLLVVY
tara:strand:- start:612 stop:974 length:363 start_codon:yes stop_codon:yes gene_type:complete